MSIINDLNKLIENEEEQFSVAHVARELSQKTLKQFFNDNPDFDVSFVEEHWDEIQKILKGK